MIVLKTDEEITIMRKAGHLAWELLEAVGPMIRPGISTQDIDNFIVSYTQKRGAKSAPLNYHGFPKSICTSVNHQVCHGIPGSRKLKEGDIVKINTRSGEYLGRQ